MTYSFACVLRSIYQSNTPIREVFELQHCQLSQVVFQYKSVNYKKTKQGSYQQLLVTHTYHNLTACTNVNHSP